MSDKSTDLYTFDEYGFRFDLEENFLDDKSAGFQIESSEIRNAAMLSRLGLILATTTLYLVSTGTAVVHQGLRHLVDPHWNRGLSYFQIGWRWIQLALTKGERLIPRFWFEPGLILIRFLLRENKRLRPLLRFMSSVWRSQEICQSIRTVDCIIDI